MDNGAELIDALSQIAREKGIDKNIIFEAIETSLISACKKHIGANANIKVVINEDTGKMQVLNQKEIVETVEDITTQISLEDAKEIKRDYEIGDIVDIEVAPRDFGRISAQTAKQVVVQKFREAEREILYQEYITKEQDIMTGIVQRRDRRNVIVALGKLEAILPLGEQMPREPYTFQDRIKVYVQEVRQTSKGPSVVVSRTSPELVKRLFEQEVPEVFDGTVEIKSIAREAGFRSKMAVYSRNPNVDPVGACVGQSGYRVNVVSNELRGEKLDIIQWSSDPTKYIAAALSPSKVSLVAINPNEQTAKAIVPDHQLSLAIGKEGQNARLAARLTGWRIDIKSASQASAINFITDEELNVDYEEFLKAKKKAEQPIELETLETLKESEEIIPQNIESEVATDTKDDVETFAETATIIKAKSEKIAKAEKTSEITEVTKTSVDISEATTEPSTQEYIDDYDDGYDDDGYDDYDDDYYDDDYYDDDDGYDDYYDDDYYDDDYYDDDYYDDDDKEVANGTSNEVSKEASLEASNGASNGAKVSDKISDKAPKNKASNKTSKTSNKASGKTKS